jgi:peptide/nickel transport system substrate-binding protein
MMKKRCSLQTWLAVLLSVMLFLTACGTTQKADNSARGGTGYAEKMIVGIADDITTFDPHNGSGLAFTKMTKMTNSTLIREDNATGALIPGIATAWEPVDKLTWKFTIRDDIKFQNGDPLTFEDIQFTFDRIRAGTRKDISYIKRLEKIDKTHFLVHFNIPFAVFPAELTGTGFSIVSHKTTKGNVIGCGPYKLVNHVSGDRIEFERFDDYYEGTPKTKHIVFRIIPETTARVIALETGEIDIAEDVAIPDRPRIANNSALQLLERVQNCLEYVGFNCVQGPTADKRVRQALILATDKKELAQAVSDGTGVASSTILGPSTKYRITDDVTWAYNPERAKRLLAEAGYPNGFTMQVLCKGSSHQLIAQMLQAQWKEVGVTVDVQFMESSAFNDATAKRRFQAFINSDNNSNDEPSEFFEELYGPRADTVGNKVAFRNKRYDELFEILLSSHDDAIRKPAAIEMQKIVMEETPVMPLFSPSDAFGAKKGVEGAVVNIGRETVWYHINKPIK